jgi:hypothetical protein
MHCSWYSLGQYEYTFVCVHAVYGLCVLSTKITGCVCMHVNVAKQKSLVVYACKCCKSYSFDIVIWMIAISARTGHCSLVVKNKLHCWKKSKQERLFLILLFLFRVETFSPVTLHLVLEPIHNFSTIHHYSSSNTHIKTNIGTSIIFSSAAENFSQFTTHRHTQ